MNWALISVLVVTAAGAWWLSAYDPRVTGIEEDRKADLIRRSVRCLITLILVGFGAEHFLRGGIHEGFIGVLFTLPLAPIWVGCVSELLSGGVQGLVDSDDRRQYDSKQVPRDLDRLAGLVSDGRNEEAIELCRQLSQSSEVSTNAMETLLFRLYEDKFADERFLNSPSLGEIWKLRAQQHFTEAVSRLDAVLKKEPHNLAASFLRMRIHAQDLHRPGRALALLEELGGQSHVPPAFVAYARRCLDEWSGAMLRREKSAVGIESLLVDRPPASPRPEKTDPRAASIDELLAGGHLATAIEKLEVRLRDYPTDFDSWMKLAEAHGVYCRDLRKARKVIDRIAANPAFSAEQIQLARTTLKEWKAIQRA